MSYVRVVDVASSYIRCRCCWEWKTNPKIIPKTYLIEIDDGLRSVCVCVSVNGGVREREGERMDITFQQFPYMPCALVCACVRSLCV